MSHAAVQAKACLDRSLGMFCTPGRWAVQTSAYRVVLVAWVCNVTVTCVMYASPCKQGPQPIDPTQGGMQDGETTAVSVAPALKASKVANCSFQMLRLAAVGDHEAAVYGEAAGCPTAVCGAPWCRGGTACITT